MLAFSSRRFDHLIFGVLHLLNRAPQRLTKGSTMPIDLMQTAIAAVLRNGDEAINLFDCVERVGHFLSQEVINLRVRAGKSLVDNFDSIGFAPCIFLRKFFRFALPHAVLDVVNVQVAAGKNRIDLFVRVPVILA
jgi:hypothetical protein